MGRVDDLILSTNKKRGLFLASLNEYSLIVRAARLTDASGYNQLPFVPGQLPDDRFSCCYRVKVMSESLICGIFPGSIPSVCVKLKTL